MPRIRDLRRFICRNLRRVGDWVDFKVILKWDYEGRRWGRAYHLRVSLREDSDGLYFEVTDFGNRFFSGYEEKVFRTLSDAINFVLSKYPRERYVFYRYVPRDIDRYLEVFTSLRYLCGFTIDEARSWSLILARAMGHLNGRRLVGFEKLGNTSKKCGRCGKGKAVIKAVFEYRDSKYSLYYCSECWQKRVLSLWVNLVREVGRIKDELLSLIETPSKQEEQELQELKLALDEDLQYLSV